MSRLTMSASMARRAKHLHGTPRGNCANMRRRSDLCAGELGSSLSAAPADSSRTGYEWKPSQDSTFFPGRQAAVFSGGKQVGAFGVVHPDVLDKFDIPYPVSALELNVEPFVFDQNYNKLQTHIMMKK